ncbi:hypothetical protein [Parasitella parasitica]|uniref:Uncharacterized protein n=1 Tax=Parasitella parasitica TaxID=35722 RepID=A0A0B7MWC8_9FUNG|nr:hypothetical protein [Parasitella parasitica]
MSPSSASVKPASLDPKYILSDLFTWQPDLVILDGVTRRENLSRALKRVDYHGIRPCLISSPPLQMFSEPIAFNLVLSYSHYYSMPHSDVATSGLPDCSHGIVSNFSRSSVSTSRLTLGALRRYWHPSRETITSRMGPPLNLPAHLRCCLYRTSPPSSLAVWTALTSFCSPDMVELDDD